MIRQIVYNILIFFALIAVLEMGLRFWLPDRGVFKRVFADDTTYRTNTMTEDSAWVQPNKDLGWVCQKKEYLKFLLPEYSDIKYKINDQGFRSNFNFDTGIDGSKKKIMLLGDSFMFGMYLPEHESISGILGQLLDSSYVIYNVSSPGWGIDQMYLAYKKYVYLIDPDLVITMYIDDDMMRNLHAKRSIGTKPKLRLVNGKLVEDNRKAGFIEKFCWTNQISNHLYTRYMQWYAVKLSKSIFQEIINMESKQGRSPHFVRLPLEKHVIENDAQILFSLSEFFENQNLVYKDLMDDFQPMSNETIQRMYLENDGHLTKYGSEVVAEILKDQILNAQL